MRKTTIKTQVTFTAIELVAFNPEKVALETIAINIPATAKTEKGIEKLAQSYIDDNIGYKVVKIIDHHKYTEVYEMDRDFFMEHAKKVNED